MAMSVPRIDLYSLDSDRFDALGILASAVPSDCVRLYKAEIHGTGSRSLHR